MVWLDNVACALEKNVYSAFAALSFLWISNRSGSLIVLFRSSISLLHFCLLDFVYYWERNVHVFNYNCGIIYFSLQIYHLLPQAFRKPITKSICNEDNSLFIDNWCFYDFVILSLSLIILYLNSTLTENNYLFFR